jgi:polyphosphate kinase
VDTPMADTLDILEKKIGQPKAVTSSDSATTLGKGQDSSPSPLYYESTENHGDSVPCVKPEMNLETPELYLNRELTWLNFVRRVLHEAKDERTPLLERVKFLAIVSSNLDEFFMKRIGGLKQQIAAGVHTPTVDGRSPSQQVSECHAIIREIQRQQETIFSVLLDRLSAYNIRLKYYQDLNEDQRRILRDNFIENIFPLLTPLAIDPAHPFPFISNLALNLLVTVRYPNGATPHMARIKVPVNMDVSPRLLRVGDEYTFVTLDDVIANNLDLLFPGMHIDSCYLFRVTRNANVEKNEEQADDLLEMIQSELRERHFAPIVRVEIMTGMELSYRGMLAAELGLNEAADVFEIDGMMAKRDLMEIANLDIPELHDPPHIPITPPRLAGDSRNIFHIIRETGPFLLQHPYESFSTSVERFLETASEDPKVLAIKMTLYRTTAEGKVIESLINAARNGKQVAVLVELKARFDEAANIRWAQHLEQAGIHVTYGVLGLKTHSKVILVIRKDYSGLSRYAHIGTGNYHSGTARQYCDLGMFTNDQAIGQDLTELFNFLTGYSPPPHYRKILVAPHTLKKSLLEKIEREIAKHTADSPGLIQFKMNALEDADITKALYRASQSGVRVDLLVRDTCQLRPGIPGLSENVRVVSVVGRFLEHTRIYYFRNAGAEEYYIGSADLMKRNLESRVEVVAPVENLNMTQDLRVMLEIQLSNKRSVWDMHANGDYTLRPVLPEDDPRSCQEILIELAESRFIAKAKHHQKMFRKKLKQFEQYLKRPQI